MFNGEIKLNVVFFRSETGTEPVRRWLKSLPATYKKAIGEVRSRLPDGIARILFTVDGSLMILLHGFINKTRKLPQPEISTARARLKQYREAGS
ncbi:MAG: type II toxin-antitoxin system RelE/ParE family toxin [Kiritimatiellia bacterium]